MNLADQLDQFLWRRALQDVSASSGFQRALDFHVTFERREYDNPGVGEFCSDGNHRVDTTLVRKSKVHECYVWVVLPELLDGFLRAGRLSYQHHIRLIVDDCGETFAQQRMIIHTENTDLSSFRHRGCSPPDCDSSFLRFLR